MSTAEENKKETMVSQQVEVEDAPLVAAMDTKEDPTAAETFLSTAQEESSPTQKASATIETPKRPSVVEALAKFDHKGDKPLMPDKTISPRRLSISRSGSDDANEVHMSKSQDKEPMETETNAKANDTPLLVAEKNGDNGIAAAEKQQLEQQEEAEEEPALETNELNLSTDSADQYVPESLSCFVKEAEGAVDGTANEEFWKHSSPRRSMGGDPLSAVSPSSTYLTDPGAPTEDESDMRLKQDLLSKYDNKTPPVVEVTQQDFDDDNEDDNPSPTLSTPFDTTKKMAFEQEEDEEEDKDVPQDTQPVPSDTEIPPMDIDSSMDALLNDVLAASSQDEDDTPVKPPCDDLPEIQKTPALDPAAMMLMDDGDLIDTGMSHEIDASEHSNVAFDGKTPSREEDRPPSPPTTHPMDYSPRRSSPRTSPKSTPNIKNTRNNRHDDDETKIPAPGSPSSLSRKSTTSSKKSLPPELKNTSRLLQPTATRRGVLSDRKKSQAEVSASRDLAKERVRSREQQMKEAEKQHQQSSPSPSRSIRMSPEEGLARARARVKIRQMQEQEMSNGTGGKENTRNSKRLSSGTPGKKSTKPLTVPQGPKLSTSKRASVRTTTEARAPNFATDKRAALRNAASAMGARPDDKSVSSQSWNSRSIASGSIASRSQQNRRGSGPNDDRSLTSASSKSTRRSLTVPQAPKFALDSKYGDKAAERRALMQKEKDERSVSSRSTISSKRSVTVPHAPKFTLDAKYGEKRPSPEKSRGSAVDACSVNSFASSLRSDKTSGSSTWHKNRITVPVAPKFHSTSKRSIPKSQEERDLEEIEKYQFKARTRRSDNGSIRSQSIRSESTRSTTTGPRKVTVPVAPKFHTTSKRVMPKSQEELDLEEMEKYNNRPRKTKTPSAKSKSGERKLTVPSAPKFHTSSRRQKDFKTHDQSDEEELKKQFRARPMPNFSKAKSPKPAPKSRIKVKPSDAPQQPFQPELTSEAVQMQAETLVFKAKPLPNQSFALFEGDAPPDLPERIKVFSPLRLETAIRARKRRETHGHSHVIAERLSSLEQLPKHRLQTKMLAAKKERDAVTGKRPNTIPVGFDLCNVRCPADNHTKHSPPDYVFQAREIPQSTYHPTLLTPVQPRKSTIPHPFVFRSSERHKERALRKHRLLGAGEFTPEKLCEPYRFRARSVPQTTYSFTPISPVEKASTQPLPFKFQTTERPRAGIANLEDGEFPKRAINFHPISPLEKESLHRLARARKERLEQSKDSPEMNYGAHLKHVPTPLPSKPSVNSKSPYKPIHIPSPVVVAKVTAKFEKLRSSSTIPENSIAVSKRAPLQKVNKNSRRSTPSFRDRTKSLNGKTGHQIPSTPTSPSFGFRARPAPKTTYLPTPTVSPRNPGSSSKRHTSPRTPASVHKPATPKSKSDASPIRTFRARPVPASTYNYTPISSSKKKNHRTPRNSSAAQHSPRWIVSV